jgi:hypothetical protein
MGKINLLIAQLVERKTVVGYYKLSFGREFNSLSADILLLLKIIIKTKKI